jgi:hypothetical protein
MMIAVRALRPSNTSGALFVNVRSRPPRNKSNVTPTVPTVEATLVKTNAPRHHPELGLLEPA